MASAEQSGGAAAGSGSGVASASSSASSASSSASAAGPKQCSAADSLYSFDPAKLLALQQASSTTSGSDSRTDLLDADARRGRPRGLVDRALLVDASLSLRFGGRGGPADGARAQGVGLGLRATALLA